MHCYTLNLPPCTATASNLASLKRCSRTATLPQDDLISCVAPYFWLVCKEPTFAEASRNARGYEEPNSLVGERNELDELDTISFVGQRNAFDGVASAYALATPTCHFVTE